MALHRILRFGQIAIVATCLTAPAAMYAAGDRSPSIDNRPLAARPDISASNLLDTTVANQFDQYLDDSFPLRDEAVKLNSFVARWLGDSTTDEVRIGRDGWLFLRSSTSQLCLDPPVDQDLAAAIDRVHNVFVHVDKQLVLAIAPDKASIFSDLYGSDRELDCMLAAADRLRTLDTSVPLVTAWEETRAAAALNEAAYRRLDTHWTSVGAAATARAIVDDIAPGLWQPEHIVEISQIDAAGDLSLLLGRQESEPEIISAADPAPGTTTTTPLMVVDRNGDTVEKRFSRSSRSTWSEAIGGTSLLLGDSFGFRLNLLVAPYFTEIDVVDGVSPHVLDVRPLVSAADLIIREQVQRDFAFDVLNRDLAAQFVIAFADKLERFGVEIVCTGGPCRAIPEAGAEVGDRYVIATLADGVQAANILINGSVRVLDLDEPAGGWFIPADREMIIEGDPALFTWSGTAVPLG
ncbi:hypothetical protein [Ilumatobacter sp.]|uniref:alginate O-acetyltransferase AlgX-related protein n=1 Tax=Ilumatobacter sp. TaxID=1967498 RepID=UPI003752A515